MRYYNEIIELVRREQPREKLLVVNMQMFSLEDDCDLAVPSV